MPRRSPATLLLLALASCRPAAAPPAAPAIAAAAAAEPYCKITGQHEATFAGDTVLKTWHLSAAGMKSLAVQLHVCADGQATTVTHAVFTWDKWDAAAPAAGTITLLVQDGKAVGAAGKRVVGLDVALPDAPGGKKEVRSSPVPLDGELRMKMSSSALDTKLWKTAILHTRVYEPAIGGPKGLSLSDTLDSAIAASKDGYRVLVVQLDWEPLK